MLLALSCRGPVEENRPPAASALSGAFWKAQAIDDIITPWTERGLPPQDSLFPAYLDRRWQPFRDDHTFPGMLARHVFSYATAYLLTGDGHGPIFRRRKDGLPSRPYRRARWRWNYVESMYDAVSFQPKVAARRLYCHRTETSFSPCHL